MRACARPRRRGSAARVRRQASGRRRRPWRSRSSWWVEFGLNGVPRNSRNLLKGYLAEEPLIAKYMRLDQGLALVDPTQMHLEPGEEAISQRLHIIN